jgi:hypothetical protein
VCQSLRRLSAAVRFLFQTLPNAAIPRQKSTRTNGAVLRRLRRVLQDMFDVVCSAESSRPSHVGLLREVLRRMRHGVRAVSGR